MFGDQCPVTCCLLSYVSSTLGFWVVGSLVSFTKCVCVCVCVCVRVCVFWIWRSTIFCTVKVEECLQTVLSAAQCWFEEPMWSALREGPAQGIKGA